MTSDSKLELPIRASVIDLSYVVVVCVVELTVVSTVSFLSLIGPTGSIVSYVVSGGLKFDY